MNKISYASFSAVTIVSQETCSSGEEINQWYKKEQYY